MRAGNAAKAPFVEPWEDGPSEAERAERDLMAAMFDGLTPDLALAALSSAVMIRTPAGEAPIAELAPGDEVETLDDGSMRILALDPVDAPEAAPVILPRGAFGATRDGAFGPQRRIFHRSGAADLLFGAPEVLIEAADLPPATGARPGEWNETGPAYALTLERPALIWANGVITESGPAPAFAAVRPVLRPMEAAA
ncbi:MAG: Hint domain-containing protein, partial [Pseudomonadota bacterium]